MSRNALNLDGDCGTCAKNGAQGGYREARGLTEPAPDITYLTLLGKPMVILNKLKPTRDFMNERSANYSNRPYSAMKGLFGVDWTLTNSDGEVHRLRRAIARILLANLLKTPDLLELHLKGSAGFRVDGATDGLNGDKLQGVASSLLEKFPALKGYPRWMLFSSFRAYGDLVKRAFVDIRADPYNRAMKMIESGTAVPSFGSTSLDGLVAEPSLPRKAQSERVELIKDCASVMYDAGTDSVGVSFVRPWLRWGPFAWFLRFTPEVVSRAQAEVDSATGEERLPTFDDQDSWPYIDALFWETLRYNTVTPLGLPHKVANDDVYEGTFIPGGATIVGNMWHGPAMHELLTGKC
ncbi:cytochrome P450 [Gautieria morchelliformis]|nr:cytochrome P450 [Gautieria morchelliformis]